MRFRLLLCLLTLAPGLCADDRWTEVHYANSAVVTNAGEKTGREVLNRLLQLQYTFGQTLGRTPLDPLWPVRLVVVKPGKDSPGVAPAPGLKLARDTYTALVPLSDPLPRGVAEDLVRHQMEDGLGRLPAGIEAGLIRLFSTVEATGTRVQVGAPPPAPERDRDWARAHLLVASPQYQGRLRVMVSNLLQGGDLDVAYRNAFEKPQAEIEKQVDAYLAAGQFAPAALSGQALSPDRQFVPRPMEPASVQLALADALLPDPTRAAEAARYYRAAAAASKAEAEEGLGLLALRDGKKEEAAQHFQAAVAAGTRSARALLESGDPVKSAAANPRWPEPYRRQAAAEKDLAKRIGFLKQAAQRDQRDPALFQTLARALFEGRLYAESGKAWGAAERAAATDAERDQIHQTRLTSEQARLDAQEAEKRRQLAERERELQKVRDQAMAEVRAAESRANTKLRAAAGDKPMSAEPVPLWQDGPPDAKVSGQLLRVDCLPGKQTRLVVQPMKDEEPAGKPISLLVQANAQLISGAGEGALPCGPLKTPKRIQAEYRKKTSAKTGTVGEVAVVELP